MIKLKDFLFLCIGITFLTLGTRGYDLSSLEPWKYGLMILFGSIFLVLSINHEENKDSKENK